MKFSRSITLSLAGLAAIAALSGCGSNNNPVGVTLDTTPPPAPVNVEIAYDAAGHPMLVWDASAAPDVVGYQVQVLSAGAGDFVQVSDPNATDTSYQIPGDITSVQETYRVRAVDGSGNWSAYSSAVSPPNSGGPEGAIEVE